MAKELTLYIFLMAVAATVSFFDVTSDRQLVMMHLSAMSESLRVKSLKANSELRKVDSSEFARLPKPPTGLSLQNTEFILINMRD